MNFISTIFNTLFVNPILNVLLLLYHLLGDFGLAIVALTIIVNLLLLPLAYRQLKAAKVRQTLAPELAELRRRHSSDLRARLDAETALYKQHGITSSSSWLGLLMQTPIYIGLYFALTTVLAQTRVSQLNALIYPFLPQLTTLPSLDLAWLSFLHSGWHLSLGLLDPTGIFPIITGLLTFVQMRLAQPSSHETLTQANQIMQFVLPCVMAAITIFITARFAAGIALYRAVSLLCNSVLRLFTAGPGSLFSMPRLAFHYQTSATNTGNSVVKMQMKQTQRKSGSARRRGKGRRRGR